MSFWHLTLAELCLAAILALPVIAGTAPPQEYESLLRRHYDAMNAGDIATAVAAFGESAVLQRGTSCPPRTPCVGHAEIRRQLTTEIGNQVRFNVISSETAADSITARVELRGAPARAAGVERVVQFAHAVVRNGRIERLEQGALDLSDAETRTFANFQRVAQVLQETFADLGRGNVAEVMNNFAENAIFEGWGICAAAACTGARAIQAAIERFVADRTSRVALPLGATRVNNNSLTARTGLTSEAIRAAGAKRIIVSIRGEVERDKFSFLRLEPDRSDPETEEYMAARARAR